MATNPFNFEFLEQRWDVPAWMQKFIGKEKSFAPWIEQDTGKRSHKRFLCRPVLAPGDNLFDKVWPAFRNIPAGYRPDNSATSNRGSLRIFFGNLAVAAELNRNLIYFEEHRTEILSRLDPQSLLKDLLGFMREGDFRMDIFTIPAGYRGDVSWEYDAEWSWYISRWNQTEKRVTTWTVGKKPKDQVGIRRSLRVPL